MDQRAHDELHARLIDHRDHGGPPLPFVPPADDASVARLNLGEIPLLKLDETPAVRVVPEQEQRIEAFVPDTIGWQACSTGCTVEAIEHPLRGFIAVVRHLPECSVSYASDYELLPWPLPEHQPRRVDPRTGEPLDEKEALLRQLEDDALAQERRAAIDRYAAETKEIMETPIGELSIGAIDRLARSAFVQRGLEADAEAEDALTRIRTEAAALAAADAVGHTHAHVDAGDLLDRLSKGIVAAADAGEIPRRSPADEVAFYAAKLNDAIIAASRQGYDIQTAMAVAQLPTGEVTLIDVVRTIRPVATVSGLASNALYRSRHP